MRLICHLPSASVTTSRDRVAVSRFTFELGDPKHLGHLLKAIRSPRGAIDCQVDQARGAPGAQVQTLELGKQAVVVPDDQLSGVDAVCVVSAAVQD